MKRFWKTSVAVLLGAGLLLAQAAPAAQPAQPAAKKQPQAKTPEEYQFYKLKLDGVEIDPKTGQPVIDPATGRPKTPTPLGPDEKIQGAEDFLQKYPDTELKGLVRKEQMKAAYGKQPPDISKTREYGEMALGLMEDDPEVLLILAYSIPQKVKDTDLDKEQNLSAAEGYAKKALDLVDKLQKPNPQITDDQWKQALSGARSQAYESLGMIADLRKQLDPAEENYKKALEQQDNANTWYRLGRILVSQAQALDKKGDTPGGTKKYEEALAAYEKVVAAGGTSVASMRDRLKKVVEDRKSAATPPKQ